MWILILLVAVAIAIAAGITASAMQPRVGEPDPTFPHKPGALP